MRRVALWPNRAVLMLPVEVNMPEDCAIARYGTKHRIGFQAMLCILSRLGGAQIHKLRWVADGRDDLSHVTGGARNIPIRYRSLRPQYGLRVRGFRQARADRHFRPLVVVQSERSTQRSRR